mmetsp:Transcript_20618/g.18258  ORF Transcript_20618/g.18258 Transcript_20618/m.18258 type:complete len:203 (-) Transcript_20618:68-676(-)
MIKSTQESENGSSKKKSNKRRTEYTGGSTKVMYISDKIFSEDCQEKQGKVKEDHFSFEENACEEELDEALNFADDTFDADDNEFLSTPLSTFENQVSFVSEISENSRDVNGSEKLVKKLEEEVEQRWKVLNGLADKTTAKTCFEYFKIKLTNLDEYQDKMESLHKFIKHQKVTNYVTMCFECYRLLCSYNDLKEAKSKTDIL